MKEAESKTNGLWKRKKKRRKSGSTDLRNAAGILLRHEGRSVIEGLAENCREGQLQSAKLLYEMAHGEEEPGDGFRSLAFEPDGE